MAERKGHCWLVRIDFQILFQFLVRSAENDVERIESVFTSVAVPGDCVDGENTEGVIKVDGVIRLALQMAPFALFEIRIDVALGRRPASVMRLANDERDGLIRPCHDGSETDIVLENFIRADPSLKILQRRRAFEFDGLPVGVGVGLADIRNAKGFHPRNQTEAGRFGDFQDVSRTLVEANEVFGAGETPGLGLVLFER